MTGNKVRLFVTDDKVSIDGTIDRRGNITYPTYTNGEIVYKKYYLAFNGLTAISVKEFDEFGFVHMITYSDELNCRDWCFAYRFKDIQYFDDDKYIISNHMIVCDEKEKDVYFIGREIKYIDRCAGDWRDEKSWARKMNYIQGGTSVEYLNDISKLYGDKYKYATFVSDTHRDISTNGGYVFLYDGYKTLIKIRVVKESVDNKIKLTILHNNEN